MTTEEHRYEMKCTWDREKIVNVSFNGKADFKVATPPDFWPESPPELLSPEDLFLASAVTCYGVSLSGIAKRYHAEFDNFEIEADSSLKQGETGWEFAEINISARIYVSSESDRKKMTKAAERAHAYCLVANSMKCPVHLRFEIILND